MIGLFHGPSQVAVYGVNFNLIAMVSGFINMPVTTAVGPMLYRQWSAGRVAESSRTLSAMTELYGIIAAIMLGGTIIVGPGVVHALLGSPYWPGSQVLVPVMIGRLFWGSSIIGHKTLELTERTLTMSVSALTAAIMNLVLNLILVPRFGFIGSAYATSFSYAVYWVIIWFQSRRVLPWNVQIGRIATYISIGLVFAYFVPHYFPRWFSNSRSGDGLTYVQLGAEASAYLLAFTILLLTVFRRRIRSLLSTS